MGTAVLCLNDVSRGDACRFHYQINGLAANSELMIFATSASDGFLKLWSNGGRLIRELQFDATLRSVCFCDDRGDLLVGFLDHI